MVFFISIGGVCASDISTVDNVSSNNGILNSNNITITDDSIDESSSSDNSHSINDSANNNIKSLSMVSTTLSSANSNTIETVLTGYDLTQVYGDAGNYTVLLTDANGNLLAGQHIQINLTRLSNGLNKVYWSVTDYKGLASLQINLAPKYYSAKADYDGLTMGDNYYAPSSAPVNNITVLSKEEVNLKSTILTGYNYAIPKGGSYYVILTDSSGNPLSGKSVEFTLSRGSSTKIYKVTTDGNGIASLSLNLGANEYSMKYSFSGDSIYSASSGQNNFVIYNKLTDISGNAIWVQGKDMYSVNFNDLVNSGIKHILLNFAAINTHGKTNVANWIASASSYGLKVHIWMQVLYHGGFQNPITSTGAINLTLLASDIQDTINFASISGVAGIHLDYMRYPGTASKTTGAANAVTLFVSQMIGAAKSVNSNLIVSGSLMPEPSSAVSSYGQNINDLTKYLEILVPMIYKGNYNAGTNWITSTTKYYAQNSNGALVWTGLQSYASDSNLVKLSSSDLTNDVKAAYAGGADNVAIFRFGLTNYVDFNSGKTNNTNPNTTPVTINDSLSIDDIASLAYNLKILIEGDYKGEIPGGVGINGKTYSTAQFLYLLTKAVVNINSGLTDDITVVDVSSKGSYGNPLLEDVSKNTYLGFANTISNYISSTHALNTYLAYGNGTISFNSLVYTFTKIMAYYYINDYLPNEVFITDLSNGNYYINVVAKPSVSSSEFTYNYYNSTFLNYCPKCGIFGTLTFNPKGVPEGELTCAHCDSDYCAVTGKDKLSGSSVYLTKIGTSIKVINSSNSSSSDDIVGTLSISAIKQMATVIYNDVASTGILPSSVTYGDVEYTLAQVSFLMANAISNIYSGYTNDVDFVDVDSPTNSSGSVKGTLVTEQYMALIYRILEFVSQYNVMPNYDKQSSNGIGQISFDTYTYAFSKILVFVINNNRLPNSVVFDSSVAKSAGSSTSTDVYVGLGEVISAAQRVQAYIASNGKLPSYTTLNNVRYSEPQFAYIMATALVNINSGNTGSIKILNLSAAPNPAGDSIVGTLSKSQYIALANRIMEFALANGYLPNFDSSNGLGKISYDNYIYLLAYALTSVGNNGNLPSYIPVNTSIIISSSGGSTGSGLNEKYLGESTAQYLVATTNCEVNDANIVALAKKLTSGLSTTLAKATAIFNFVRDDIDYSYYANTRYGAAGTLSMGKGNCVDEAHLVIALCRAAGIPARYVHGKGCTFSSGLVTGHVWAQVLVDGVWYVADATSRRNSFGKIVNWNTNSFTVAYIGSYISF